MSTIFPTPDLGEKFPRLAKPPIVEAVIHWQAVAQNRLEPESLTSALAKEFQGFTQRRPLHTFGMMAQVSTNSDTPVVKKMNDWGGIRLKSDDNKYAIQFRRDGLAFSRT